MSRSAAPPLTSPVDGNQTTVPPPVEQTGSPLFAELVWAHHRYEQGRRPKGASDDEIRGLQQAYLDKLDEFQKKVGTLDHVYWSTKGASAVAMTVALPDRRHGRLLAALGAGIVEYDEVIQIHRLTDWVTSDAPAVADLLHECDLLAIRVGEVLRGTPERIAMRSILGVQAHLLGYVERTEPLPDEREKSLVKGQREELAAVEGYYHRAASRAGRLVYITGMLMGLIPVVLLGALFAILFWWVGDWDSEETLLFLCAGAGGVGAVVSAVSRMGKPERGRFNVDFELGRPLIRRLGFYRPFLGAIAGLALYALLASGIAQVTVTGDEQVAYYGFAAFLAGFSERFATVMFGTAERRLSQESS